MRQAAKDYKKYSLKKQEELPTTEDPSAVAEKSDSSVEIILEVSETPEIEDRSVKEKLRVDTRIIGNPVERNDEYEDQEIESEEETKELDVDCGSMTEVKSEQEHGYLRYFFLTKLFA